MNSYRLLLLLLVSSLASPSFGQTATQQSNTQQTDTLNIKVEQANGGQAKVEQTDARASEALQNAYNSGWEERRKVLIDSLVRVAYIKRDSLKAGKTLHPRHRLDMLEALLLIKHGKDAKFGNQIILQEVEKPFRGGMFFIHDVMATYLYGGNLLDKKVRAAVRHSLKTHTIYRGDTENHWLLYYTGLYLAAQTFPGQAGSEWFNGRSSDENFKEAKEWIEHWMELTTTIGQGEFDSPTYFIVFIGPLYTLYEHAQDPVMKEKARVMLDWLWTDYAVDHLDGRYAGAHSRDYTYDAVLPEYAPAAGWAWFHFGGTARALYRVDNLLSAWSGYRLPQAIAELANDRSVPYWQMERKRTRHVIRYGYSQNPPVYKSMYMSKNYALGSIQGGILQPIQQHTWDVTWAGLSTNNTVFSLHPYYEGRELAMFFPEEEEWLSDEVDRYHKVYTDPNKWNSSSPYEHVFQHNNALIVLYDIPEGAQHPHIDGYFPKHLKARDVDASGWIFMDTGNAWLAWYPLAPYTWIEANDHWRLRSTSLKNGLILEAAEYTDYTDFEAFKEQIRSNKIDTSWFASDVMVRYTRSDGRLMRFGVDGIRQIDRERIEWADLPLFKGDRVNSKVPQSSLYIQNKHQTHTIDFK